VINVTNVTLDDAARLGSTTFKLTSSMVSAGSSITLGNQTIAFSDASADATTPAAAGKVYVGDLDLSTEEGMTEVAARITRANAAGTNPTFSVGYNGSQITLLESSTTVYRGNTVDYDLSTLDGWKKALTYTSAPSAGGALTLQIGDTADDFNKLKVSITDMHTQSLGINGIDISTQEGASTAIDKIKAAINKVSSTRGDLGAIQNRLEHTGNNLSVMTENIQDAESTIRDTDIAEEMMSYTKNNILVQSAQAMLAQANSVPQGVLQLLQ
jgi:flagellin